MHSTCRPSNAAGGAAEAATHPAEATLAPERPEDTLSDMSRTASLMSTETGVGASTARTWSSASTDTIVSSWGGSITKVTQYARHVDLQRPIGSFSDEELDAIACAAEFLRSFDFMEESFPLYALLLKKERAAALAPDSDTKVKVAWAAKVYEAARCTEVTEHHEEALELLADAEAVMKQVSSAPSRPRTYGASEDGHRISLHNFLRNMSIAYVRCRDKSDWSISINHYKRACRVTRTTPRPHAQLMDAVPAENTSLCWMLHIDLFRCLVQGRSSVDLLNNQPWEFLGSYTSSVGRKLEDTLLYRKPGPFELYKNKEGELVAQNPCLRSCLEWCYQQLQSLQKMSGVVRMMPFSGKVVAWGANTAVFTALWERYVTSAATARPRGSAKATGADGAIDPMDWMRDTERRFGLPPTEMLLMMTWLINLAGYFPADAAQQQPSAVWITAATRQAIARTPRFRTRAKVLAHFRAGCEMLRAHNDEYLARRFIRNYVDRESLCIWPWWRCAAQHAARSHLMSDVARVLHIKIPEKCGAAAAQTVAMSPEAEAAADTAAARSGAVTTRGVLRSSLRVLTGCLQPITTSLSCLRSGAAVEAPDQAKVNPVTYDSEKVLM